MVHPVIGWLIVLIAVAMAAAGVVQTLAAPSSSIGTTVRVIAVLSFGAVACELALIDLRTHRLPDRLVLPAIAAAVVLGIVIAAADQDWSRLWRALAGAGVLFAVFLVAGMATGGGIGGGDVKLACLIGGICAWSGWLVLATAVVIAFLLGGMAAAVLMLRRRADRHTRIALGPALLFGCGAALLVG